MTQVTFEILIILAMLIANGIFAMTEIAVVSARKGRLKQLSDEGRKSAQLALQLAESPSRFLSTVQVGITLVGIFAGAFGGATLSKKLAVVLKPLPYLGSYAEPISFAVVVLTITYLSLVIGELVPKRFALANPEGIAMAMAGTMNKISWLAHPIVSFLSASTEGLLKLFGFKPAQEATVSEEEVKTLIREGLRSGVFLPTESAMVESVLAFDRMPVKDLMTPRSKIIWINVNDSHETIWHKIVVSGHTTFPVFEGSRDRVIGTVSIKSIYANLAAGTNVKIKDLMVPPLIIPATQSSIKALELFKTKGKYIALVADEFGSIVGLVTLHDMMEAIAGDFSTQNEKSKPTAKRRDDGSWLIDGMLDIEDFDRLVPEFKADPPAQRDYQTFGGFVIRQLGRVPEEGESFQSQGFLVEIIDMDGHRVDKILLIPLRAQNESPGPDTGRVGNVA